jgi:vanadium chloroperoxidase
LFPSQKAFFEAKHQEAGLQGPCLAAGHDFGLLVAQRILDDRKDDPGVGDNGYAPSMARGRHRVDPDHPDQGYHAPFYGARAKCFAVTDRHGLLAPPALGSAEYMSALDEVLHVGIKPELAGMLNGGSVRTPDQTVVGVFWGYDGAIALGTPPRLYNQIIREVATHIPNPANPPESPLNTPLQNARLFAMVNAAMADAGILAWDQKYIWEFWRPVLGIREHDESMGPAGIGDDSIGAVCQPNWLPLGAPNSNGTGPKNFTPPFPAYPSGHATFGAAAFHIARLFYNIATGDRGPDNLFQNLTFVSEEHNGATRDNNGTVRPKHVRSFPGGLWQMIEENGRSRVYLGVHWVFDAFAVDDDGDPDYAQNIGGVNLGCTIAEDIFASNLTKSDVGPRS